MRTFDVTITASKIVQEKTFYRIPEKLKLQADCLRTCVGDVVLRLTKFIGSSIHFLTALTSINFSITEGYRILGTYTMFIKPAVNGTRVSVCDAATNTFIPNLGFVVALPKPEQKMVL